MTDLLVRGGSVVDGTGSSAQRADVRVRGGRIVEIERDLQPTHGETTLDASGALVTPGLIDTHTHFDPSLFWDPTCDPMPQHGVTSVLFGNCGLSLAPVTPAGVEDLTRLFCYVEDLPEHAFEQCIPWTWTGDGSYAAYTREMRSRAFSLNAAGLVGHSILRMYVLGAAAWERPSTPAEIEQIAGVLDDALRAGAFGLSTSLGFDEDRDKRLVPSRIAADDEFDALLAVLAKHRRIVQFIPSPVPKYMRVDVERMTRLCQRHDVVNTWIGIFRDDLRPQSSMQMLDYASELQSQGARTFPQISPRTLDIQLNWNGGMSLMTLADTWHRLVQEPNDDAKRAMLSDREWRDRARVEWDRVPFTMIQHHRPHNVRLVSVTRAEHEEWVGRSLADLVAARGQHPSDVLADWVLENDLRPGVVGVGIANGDPDGVAETLTHPAAIVSNSDAGAHLQMMCAVGDGTLLLTRHVRERGDFTIEAAIHQLTGRQAEIFGFADRGVIAPGTIADLTVFDLDELRWSTDSFVTDLPGDAPRLRRPPGGYRYTVVSGEVTQIDGQLTPARPGTMLG